MKQQGFTLIELLIVIAIIAILAATIFVALDPLQRFQDARNARRWSDADAIISAIKLDQVDNGGNYHTNISSLSNNTPYMIVDGTSTVDMSGVTCTAVGAIAANDRVDLEFLVTEGYLADVPVSPNGDETWADDNTGYVLTTIGNNTQIEACETEGGTVSIVR